MNRDRKGSAGLQQIHPESRPSQSGNACNEPKVTFCISISIVATVQSLLIMKNLRGHGRSTHRDLTGANAGTFFLLHAKSF